MHHAQAGLAELLIATSVTDAGTAATATWDCDRGAYLQIFVVIRTEATNTTVTVSLLEDDTTTVSNFATVTADLNPTVDSSNVLVRYEVDLRGRQRYLRLTATSGTASNNDMTVHAVGVIYNAFEGPGNTTEMMVGGTSDSCVIVT